MGNCSSSSTAVDQGQRNESTNGRVSNGTNGRGDQGSDCRLDIYYNVMSQPSRSILMFAKLNKIKYNGKVIDIFAGETRTPEYLAMNPKHTIPVIMDDGFVVTESSSAVKYLASKYKAPDHCYPADVKTRALVNEILDWRVTIRAACMGVFYKQALGQYMGMEPLSAEELDAAYKELGEAMDMLGWYLKDKKFLCCEEISIADLFVANELIAPTFCERDIYVNHPKIKAWMDRVREALNPIWDEIMDSVKEMLDHVQAGGKNANQPIVDQGSDCKLDIYYNVMSQPSRSILMFAKLNKIKYNGKVIDIFAGETRTPEYLAMNPKHTIPVIKDDGFVVTESSSAVKYLASKYNAPDHCYPADVKTRALVNEILDWRVTIRAACMGVFYKQALGQYMGMDPLSAEELDAAYKELGEAMDMLGWYLKDKKFLCCEEISIADLFVANELIAPTFCERDIYVNHPKIKAWMDRVREALNPVWDEIMDSVKEMLDNIQGKK